MEINMSKDVDQKILEAFQKKYSDRRFKIHKRVNGWAFVEIVNSKVVTLFNYKLGHSFGRVFKLSTGEDIIFLNFENALSFILEYYEIKYIECKETEYYSVETIVNKHNGVVY